MTDALHRILRVYNENDALKYEERLQEYYTKETANVKRRREG